jgi:hypothetical protein
MQMVEKQVPEIEKQALAYAEEIDSEYQKEGLVKCPNCRKLLGEVLESSRYLRLSVDTKATFLNSLWAKEAGDEEDIDESCFYDPAVHLP